MNKIPTKLSQTAERLQQAGKDELQKGAGDGVKAVESLAFAIGTANGAKSDLLAAGIDVVVAGAHAMGGAALATAGALVKATELVGDMLGTGLQHFGRALIGAGNWLRKHQGGPQIVASRIEGAEGNPLSARLFSDSKHHFGLAGNALVHALADLSSSGDNLTRASLAVLEAAQHVALAAGHGMAGGASHAAAVAVDASRAAVQAAQQGADGAGALLQEAGKAVILAGNALTSDRGAETAVIKR